MVATPGRHAPATVKEVVPHYPFDIGDKRRLAGIADNIFIGKVDSKIDTALHENGIAYTKFAVDVVGNMKGNASGMVIAEQQGGHYSRTNTIYTVKGDRILSVGNNYLFVATFESRARIYNIVNGYGDIPLTSGEVSAYLAGNPPRSVIDMRDAVANQILPK